MTRNLIFDVGDVLLEYRWFEMLTEDMVFLKQKQKRIGGEMFDREIWEMGLDGGRLTTDEAIARYKERYPKDGKVNRLVLEKRPSDGDKTYRDLGEDRSAEKAGLRDLHIVQLFRRVVSHAYRRSGISGYSGWWDRVLPGS